MNMNVQNVAELMRSSRSFPINRLQGASIVQENFISLFPTAASISKEPDGM